MRGRVEFFRFESQALAGNPLGDPVEREVAVYLPPGHDDGGRRFPVVLLLPGFGSGHRSLLNFDLWSPKPVERFDRLVAAGDAAPAILVLPDATNRWGGSQFVDSAGTGAYQTFLADEVFPEVDARYRTVPERAGRAVAGTSSGGFGALRLALDRPDLVAAVASHCADAAFEVSLWPMLPPAQTTWDLAGGLPAFAAAMVERGPRTGPEHEALFVLAALAAYAPDPAAPAPHVAVPYDPETMARDEAAWGAVCAHDPVVRIEQDADALRDLALVYVDAGDRDEHGLQYAARRLARALRARGAPVEHHEFEGGHRNTGWRYGVSLPRVVSVLSTG